MDFFSHTKMVIYALCKSPEADCQTDLIGEMIAQ